MLVWEVVAGGLLLVWTEVTRSSPHDSNQTFTTFFRLKVGQKVGERDMLIKGNEDTGAINE